MRLVAWESTDCTRPTRHIFQDLPALRANVPRLQAPPLLDVELDGGANLDAEQAAQILRATDVRQPGVLATGRLIHHLSPREVHDADGLLPVDASGESLPCPVYHLARGLGGTGPAPKPRSLPDASAQLCDIAASLPQPLHDLEIARIPNAGARASRIPPEQDVHTVGALRNVTDAMFLTWRGAGVGSLEKLKRALIGVREIDSQLPTLARLPTDAPNRPPVLSRPLLVQIAERMAELDDRRREVARQRAISEGPPATLEAVGNTIGLTRERVRQLANTLATHLDPSAELRSTIDARLARLRHKRNAPLELDQLTAEDAWFEGAGERPFVISGTLQTLQSAHAVIQWGAAPAFVSLRAAADLPRLIEALKANAETWTDEADLPDAVRTLLGEIDTPELTALLVRELGDCRCIEGKVVFDPSVAQWVTWALDQADGPISLEEIRARLAAVSISVSPGGVRGAANALDLINAGRRTYVLPAKLKMWAPHKSAFRAVIQPIMEASPARQWNLRELRDALREADESWAQNLPLHVVEYLLGLTPEIFERLGRGLCGLKGREVGSRIQLRDLCTEILERAGTPLRQIELRDRVREQRGTCQQIPIFWPLVHLFDGRIGLGPRDLGLSTAAFEQMRETTVAQLENTGRVSGEDLKQLLTREGPEGLSLPPQILCRVMRACSRTLLDGSGQGSGIRRADMQRLGSNFETLRPARGPSTPRKRPASRSTAPKLKPRAPKPPVAVTPRAPAASRPSVPGRTLADIILALGPGHTLEQIADAMAQGGLRRPAMGLLRMQLRMSGWIPVGDCWHPQRL